jgi:hypothetical protein
VVIIKLSGTPENNNSILRKFLTLDTFFNYNLIEGGRWRVLIFSVPLNENVIKNNNLFSGCFSKQVGKHSVILEDDHRGE